jgi:adenylylsulfate kinase
MSWAIWVTGRPGSGKTTVAGRVAEALAARGIRVKVLDLAAARDFLSPPEPAADKVEETAHRMLVHATRLLTEAGIGVIVDATAPRRAWREAARELIPSFAEVQLVCPAEICAERERAVRWGLSAAQRGRPAGPSGHGAPLDMAASYEESLRPELVLDTHAYDVSITVEQVLFLVHRLRRRASNNLELA